MSYVNPEPCSWGESQWPCTKDSLFHVEASYPKTDGPDGFDHTVNTNYVLTVGNKQIPIIRTNRTFEVSYSTTHSMPTSRWVAVKNLDGSMAVYDCDLEIPPSQPSLTVREHCSIETSILHYLDQRYGLCLYKYVKDELNMEVTSSELAGFKVPEGSFTSHQAQIKTDNYSATSTVEWRLVLNDEEIVLSSTTTTIHPFGPKNDGTPFTEGFAAGWVPDPETRKILVFPQPPSLAIPLTPEIVRLGFYDYGNLPGEESDLNKLDGGYKDMYYPEWCRNLQEDRIWRENADIRYNISWFHTPPVESTNYEPPPIQVEPIPVGSYVKHHTLGEIYQWLVGGQVYTSKDLIALLDSNLPEDLKTHDTTLLYPISLA